MANYRGSQLNGEKSMTVTRRRGERSPSDVLGTSESKLINGGRTLAMIRWWQEHFHDNVRTW